MKKLLMTAGAAILALATTSQAATLSIEGGTDGFIPGGSAVNDVLQPLLSVNSLGGKYGSKIKATGFTSADKVLVEVMGYEAGAYNTFAAGLGSYTSGGGTLVAPNLSTPLAKWTTTDIVGDLLSFMFKTGGSVSDPDVVNGESNQNLNGKVNFFASKLVDGSIWLFMDDGGGFNDDDNHDDLVIRLSAIPLPAGGVLLLTGLGALALRRRKQA